MLVGRRALASRAVWHHQVADADQIRQGGDSWAQGAAGKIRGTQALQMPLVCLYDSVIRLLVGWAATCPWLPLLVLLLSLLAATHFCHVRSLLMGHVCPVCRPMHTTRGLNRSSHSGLSAGRHHLRCPNALADRVPSMCPTTRARM